MEKMPKKQIIFLQGKKNNQLAASAKLTLELHGTNSDFFRHWVLQRYVFIIGEGRHKTIPGTT